MVDFHDSMLWTCAFNMARDLPESPDLAYLVIDRLKAVVAMKVAFAAGCKQPENQSGNALSLTAKSNGSVDPLGSPS